MQVRLIKQFRGKGTGKVIEWPDDLAANLIEAKIAEPLKAKAEKPEKDKMVHSTRKAGRPRVVKK